MENKAQITLIRWEIKAEYTLLVGELRRPARKKIIHREAIVMSNELNAWLITDWISGMSSLPAANLHFATGIQPETISDPFSGLNLKSIEGILIGFLIEQYNPYIGGWLGIFVLWYT
jgi:hypothetical protein